jgi:hypothetical protein
MITDSLTYSYSVEEFEILNVKVGFLYLGVEDVCHESMAGVVSGEALLQPFQHLVADSNLTYERKTQNKFK